VFTSGLHTSSIQQLKVRSSASNPGPEGASQIRKANLNLQQQIQLPVSDWWWSRAFNDLIKLFVITPSNKFMSLIVFF